MPHGNTTSCRNCGQPIEWALNPSTGKRVPINSLSETSSKDVRATWAAWDNPDGGYFVRPITRVEPLNVFSEHPAINHVVFCPVPAHQRQSRSRGRAPARSRART